MVRERNETFKMMIGLAGLVVAAVLTGCESTTMNNEGVPSLGDLQGDATSSAGADSGYEAEGTPSEITGPIKWLNPVGDISGWAQTATLQAHVGGGSISLAYDKSTVWPARDGVNATPWAIVNINGQWYAATFEYLKVGQMSKPMTVLSQTGGKGDHFKVAPLSSWRPRSGERFGLMVSGLARGTSLRNVKERSNICMVTWP